MPSVRRDRGTSLGKLTEATETENKEKDMNRPTSLFAQKLTGAIMVLGATQPCYGQQALETNPITRTQILKQVLPPGDYRNVQGAIVELAPGASAPRHRHDVAVLAYVLEGSVENQFDSGALLRHNQGDSWWEAPGTVHNVVRNTSETQRARLLVVYIGEEGKAASVPLN
jgi:quercetin dioxygenase-like cupin family protein